MRPKIVIAANAAWNLANFRAGLIRGLATHGYEIIAAAPPDPDAEARLTELGCRFAPIPIDSKGLSFHKDMATLAAFTRLFRIERPLCYLGYTVKPNVYGSIAARLAGVPAINNISGLGTAFIRQSWLTVVVKWLYRIGLQGSDTVFFQNQTDLAEFTEARLVRPEQAHCLPGSGVDVELFKPAAEPRLAGGALIFLLIARMVRDKGVAEFVEAARMLRARLPGSRLRFQLLGFLDVENRTAISRAKVNEWVEAGDVEYLGASADVRPFIEAADCVVLPSYREGTSRVLLEAAAMAKPLIASDVPGCREVVDDGTSGYLCRVRDPASLADAMQRFVSLALEDRSRMGGAGREKIVKEFDERIVVSHYLDRIGRLVSR